MKKSVIMLIAFSMMAACVVHAQDETIPPQRSRGAKVGALAGFTMGYLFMDTAPVNDFLTAGGAAPVSSNGVFLYGGAGAAYIMLVKNLRVGGIGMSGHSSSSALDASGTRRDAKLTAGYGAITFEYVVPLLQRLDLIGGLNLGWGGIDIELRKSTGTATSWLDEQNFLKSPDLSPTNNVTRTLSGHFFIWTPSVSLEYAFLGYLGVRVGVSYLGMSSPSWEVDNNFSLVNVPSNVTGKGWMVNGGIFLGTF